MKSVTLKAYAKLNLALEVVGKYHDGFHNIDTLFASVSVFDTLTLTKNDSKQNSVVMQNTEQIASNSAQKAADLFVGTFNTCGAEILVNKAIPVAGGMGGSSADAAGVLAGMCKLYGVPVDTAAPLAERLGSDTAFMLKGGYARGQGKGGQLNFFEAPKLHFVVVCAPFGLFAADVYREYDITTDSSAANVLSLIKKIQKGVVPPQSEFVNNLQTAALRLSEEVNRFYTAVSKIAPVTMTGSGSCFFAVASSKAEAQSLCGKFKAEGIDSLTCDTCPCGIEVIRPIV